MFGLPWDTTLIVFGGFSIAVVLSVVFGLLFSTESDEWGTIDGLLSRFRGRK
ncbi:hypothetical protein HQ32_04793 [Prauserella sp. Am3]|nr:hypothetical protein HQ32_04793 [Prauserella sp. Am3]